MVLPVDIARQRQALGGSATCVETPFGGSLPATQPVIGNHIGALFRKLIRNADNSDCRIASFFFWSSTLEIKVTPYQR